MFPLIGELSFFMHFVVKCVTLVGKQRMQVRRRAWNMEWDLEHGEVPGTWGRT